MWGLLGRMDELEQLRYHSGCQNGRFYCKNCASKIYKGYLKNKRGLEGVRRQSRRTPSKLPFFR